MNYYFDTEFIEGPQKKSFLGIPLGKTKPTIDLISIGIVSEDNGEYYAISDEFNLNEAWNRFQIEKKSRFQTDYSTYDIKVYWIRENVLRPIFDELTFKEFLAEGNGNIWKMFINDPGIYDLEKWRNECIKYSYTFSKSELHRLINKYGKSNYQISEEIKNFVNPNIFDLTCKFTRADAWSKTFYPEEFKYIEKHNTFIPNYQIGSGQNGDNLNELYNRPAFYAYYADYDWVVFCWLFGAMMDLPNGFPMFCIDLKQEIEHICDDSNKFHKEHAPNAEHRSHERMKRDLNYPNQENEHNALDDARWNKKLHEFLKTL